MTSHNGPRHAGKRSSIFTDLIMRIRYAFRFIFCLGEYAAYADTDKN